MTTVLESIIQGVREDLATRMAQISTDQIAQIIPEVSPALDPMPSFRSPQLSVIAEVKRKSPSKGELATIDDPAALASHYEQGGAAACSVLTEQRRFDGSLGDLDRVRASVDIPVLRKDFMVDPYQFLEARAHGADLVLLIVAALDQSRLEQFLTLTADLGMTALVEAHTADEVHRALDCGAQLIGINNRNLKTLEVDLNTFAPLAEIINDQAVIVAESGLRDLSDARRFAAEGADVVLVGEALVRHGDPTRAVAEFCAIETQGQS